MRILLLRTWTTNIGNGFIDYGARAMLENAFPDAEIVETGGYPNHASDTAALWGGTRKLARMTGYDRSTYESPTHPLRRNTVHISELIDADLAVLPGCVLSRPTFRKYFDTLRQLRERDVPIVVVGGGGEKYDDDERRYVEAVFDALDIDVLLTRDRTAYEEYGDLVEYLYDGIDCSLFLGDRHRPPEANRAFDVHTFDKEEEPDVGGSRTVIRPDHAPFDEPYHFPVGERARELVGLETPPFEVENAFVSDLVTDYLFLYANADVVRSDRIHACLPALTYGNRAQFYFETPRANLFDRVPIDGDVTSEPVRFDMDALEREKEAQVEALEDGIATVL
ncbi:polysaccharide pyruvyl transferase family protein [Natrinema salsiterrestre]|uniref:Polysaccharide pyruvyl transferase family protein n=1 Tax=Natrinema salsiterrestre TaxID=2950540 RepID=A0A9Q4KYR5_9EURY|nr:polysaccharide pyruvyl transferase family protein [Natrinema salsiterrestre]MDF9744127.1 polysaccharide pyruvyl transferase family protein [Natrinema salsiterrestre]